VADREERTDSAVKERVEIKRQDPTLYAVVLLNDDYTPMQFVVDVLESLFEKMPAEAHRIMMQVHVNGRGIAGVYPWEVAETKADKVASLANHAGHPLRATVEEV
jgi:ATP-dependent Clp protease adaptor protein ClpS